MKFRDVGRITFNGQIIGLDITGDISYVSHAHSDHVHHPKKKKIIASDQTIDIAGITYKERINFKEIELIPAGHLFGATQIRLPYEGGILTYTGDLSLKDGFTYKGAEVRETDSLIIESTYGHPNYNFPNKYDIVDNLVQEIKSKLKFGNVIFGVYHRGKAQEIIKIINEYLGMAPLVHSEIEKPSLAYIKHGVKLDFISTTSNEGQEQLKSNFVAIVPKMKINFKLKTKLRNIYSKPLYFVSLSGWNLSYYPGYYDLSIPFSDHADYNQLVEYVEQANPAKIYVFGPYANVFSKELKKKGYKEVIPLNDGSAPVKLGY